YRTQEGVVAAAGGKVFRVDTTKGGPLPPMIPKGYKSVPFDTRGKIENTGDPKVDGDVKDIVELMHKVGDSPRVRQVFVRHAFRYWMGRNETLADAPTLRAADKAYVEGGGSMKALIVSLLSSDSFVYRKVPQKQLA